MHGVVNCMTLVMPVPEAPPPPALERERHAKVHCGQIAVVDDAFVTPITAVRYQPPQLRSDTETLMGIISRAAEAPQFDIERIEKLLANIREMTAWIAEAQMREADLEHEAERLQAALREAQK